MRDNVQDEDVVKELVLVLANLAEKTQAGGRGP